MKKEFTLADTSVIRFFNLKNEDSAEKATSLVKYKVWACQYDGIVKTLPIDDFMTAHPGADFWSAPREDFDGVVDADAIDDVLEARANALTVRDAIDALPYGLDAWNALPDSDKCFLIIEAHKSMPGVVLEKYLFRSEKGVDLTGLEEAVKAFYKSGKKKDLANVLRAMFFKVCGNAGELFTGLSFTRAEWANTDLVDFAATFGGRAKRATKKGKDGTVTVLDYDYVHKFGSWKTQSVALTTLLGVVMESRRKSYCKVIEG